MLYLFPYEFMQSSSGGGVLLCEDTDIAEIA